MDGNIPGQESKGVSATLDITDKQSEKHAKRDYEKCPEPKVKFAKKGRLTEKQTNKGKIILEFIHEAM